jgi:hypothetical protein
MMAILRCGALSLFALATVSCGVDGATPAEVEARGAALRTSAETSAVLGLECGDFHVEITRSRGSSGSRSVAEDRCADALRRARPTVRCAGCSIRGACEPLTRRSDIFYTCEYEDDAWECTCAQRAVLGCYPCRETDASGAPGTTSCAPSAHGPPPEAAPVSRDDLL